MDNLADRPSRGNSALYHAFRASRHDVVRLLVKGGIRATDDVIEVDDDPARQATLLYLAASEGHLDLARLFLENGATLEARSRGGHTALMGAVSTEDPRMVEFLLSRGAEVNAMNDPGHTALCYAFREPEDVKFADFLSVQDSYWNARDVTGALVVAGANRNGCGKCGRPIIIR